MTDLGTLQESSIDTALELMERALAILVAVDMTGPVCDLQVAIDSAMVSPGLPEDEYEGCDLLSDFPHPMRRSFELHRQNGLTAEQIGQRLGITCEQAARYIQAAQRHIAAPYMN